MNGLLQVLENNIQLILIVLLLLVLIEFFC